MNISVAELLHHIHSGNEGKTEVTEYQRTPKKLQLSYSSNDCYEMIWLDKDPSVRLSGEVSGDLNPALLNQQFFGAELVSDLNTTRCLHVLSIP